MNRDYFVKPIQSSRSADYYGNTGPLVGMSESSGGAAFMMILSSADGGLVLALMFFAWIS